MIQLCRSVNLDLKQCNPNPVLFLSIRYRGDLRKQFKYCFFRGGVTRRVFIEVVAFQFGMFDYLAPINRVVILTIQN